MLFHTVHPIIKEEENWNGMGRKKTKNIGRGTDNGKGKNRTKS
jgi:hypothetical protein